MKTPTEWTPTECAKTRVSSCCAKKRVNSRCKNAARIWLVSLLSGCAACLPTAKVEMLPLSAPCMATRPMAPVLPAVPAHGIFDQVQALLAREQLRAAYARQLELLLDACAGDESRAIGPSFISD